MRNLVLRTLGLALALSTLGAPAGFAQPAVQVKDIGTAVPLDSPFRPGKLAEVGGVAYFMASDGIHGHELWRTDGTAAGTWMVKDLCPGSCSSSPGLTVVGTQLFFVNIGLPGPGGLWKTDGTAAGTVPTGLVFPSFIVEMEELDGALILWGHDGNIWRSDGTPAGTVQIRQSAFQTGDYPRLFGRTDDLLLFGLADLAHGYELWKTDGTEAGTALVKDIRPGSTGSISRLYTPFNSYSAESPSQAFFSANDGTHGEELWVSDGTAAGTVPVDVYPGAPSGNPYNITAFGDSAFFSATAPSVGLGLWKSDGTDAGTVFLGSFSSMYELTPADGRLFFKVTATPPSGELWTSDGTEAGTVFVKDLQLPGSGGSPLFLPLGGGLVFFASDGVNGFEPWKSDGTGTGTVPLADLEPGAGSSFGGGTDHGHRRDDSGFILGDRWLFGARTASHGWALWKSDGTPAGTEVVLPIDTQTSGVALHGYGADMLDLGGTLLFPADDGAVGSELWKSDGSGAGTTLVEDLRPGPDPSRPGELTLLGGQAVFKASSDDFGLWKTDGTAAGTEELTGPNGSPFNVQQLTAAGGQVFFAGYDPLSGTELWVTDGTPAGTRLTRDIVPGFKDSSPIQLTPFGDLLLFKSSLNPSALWRSDGSEVGTYFLALNGNYPNVLAVSGNGFFYSAFQPSTGYELWWSDGTLAGSRLVKDLQPGPFGSLFVENDPYYDIRIAALLGDRLLFLGKDGLAGLELWVSDGTAAGTLPLTDMPGSDFPFADYELVAAGNKVYFVAQDGTHGYELWVSDGTPAGTRLVRDIVPGAGSSLPEGLAAAGNLLLFSAFDETHGRELWRTDGTEAGTWRIQDIAPGLLPSSPYGFTASGSRVYFAATEGTDGFELWAMPRTALGAHLTATKEVSGQLFTGGTVTYTVRITNNGPADHPDRPGHELTDVLPAPLTLTGATADTGTVGVGLATNTVTWNGALASGASATVTIQAVIEPGSSGLTVANQASLSFDADGDGVHESSGASDAAGVFGAANATSFKVGLGFHTVTPCRVFDTRSGSALSSDTVRTFAVAGACGIPASARSVAANLTVLGATGIGHLTAWAAGTAAPGTSILNFGPGQVRANNAILPVSLEGVDVRATVAGGGTVHLILDVTGYFE